MENLSESTRNSVVFLFRTRTLDSVTYSFVLRYLRLESNEFGWLGIFEGIDHFREVFIKAVVTHAMAESHGRCAAEEILQIVPVPF